MVSILWIVAVWKRRQKERFCILFIRSIGLKTKLKRNEPKFAFQIYSYQIHSSVTAFFKYIRTMAFIITPITQDVKDTKQE